MTDPGGLVDLYDALVDRWTPGRAHQAIRRFEALVEKRSGGSAKYDLSAWSGGGGWLEGRVRELVAELSYHETGSRFIEAGPLEPQTAASALAGFVRDFYQRAHPDTSAFVDDTPDSIPLLAHVRAIFPDARFVWIVRDPRDVLASFNAVYAKGRWTSDTTETNARRIGAVLDACMHVHYTAMVRLEELAERPAELLTALCRRIGIDYRPEMVRPVDRAAAHVGRWRKELKSRKASLVARYVQRLGYE